MVEEYELNTFIVKFKQLWKSVLNAHLDLDTSAGKAWVGLRLHLGDAPLVPQHHHQDTQNYKDSPARERRRNRRANLRKDKCNDDTRNKDNEVAAEEPIQKNEDKTELTEKVEPEVLVYDTDTAEDVDPIDEVQVDETAEKVDMENTIEEVNKVEVREIVKLGSIVENTDLGESCKVKESAESPIEVETTEKVKVTDESPPNDSIGATTSREASTAVVYATAVFKNSPVNQLTRNNMNSLSDIIDSKEHLQRNIENFKFGNVSTWKAENQKFDHQMQVILEVKTVQLWESARGYLWKHLGTSLWPLHDGTEVSLVRIHQR